MVEKAKKKKKTAPKKKPLVERGYRGRLKKGSILNPHGRPKGSGHKASIDDLYKALKEVEKDKKKTLMKHFLERAFEEDAVMINAVKKFIPDLKSIDIRGNVDGDFKITINRK